MTLRVTFTQNKPCGAGKQTEPQEALTNAPSGHELQLSFVDFVKSSLFKRLQLARWCQRVEWRLSS